MRKRFCFFIISCALAFILSTTQNFSQISQKESMLSSLSISPNYYFLGQKINGELVISNPSRETVPASFRTELYKKNASGSNIFVGLQDTDNFNVAPGISKIGLDTFFGFGPIIPLDSSYIGNYTMKIKKKITSDSPNDFVSASFSISAREIKISFNMEPSQYSFNDVIKGKGRIVNGYGIAIPTSFKADVFKNNNIVWSGESSKITVQPGNNNFTLKDVFGFEPKIPPNREFIGNWKLKIALIRAPSSTEAESYFSIAENISNQSDTNPQSKILISPGGGVHKNSAPGLKGFTDTWDLLTENGVNMFPFTQDWKDLEPSPGQFNLHDLFINPLTLVVPRYPQIKGVIFVLKMIDTNLRVMPMDLMKKPFDDPLVLQRFDALIDAIAAEPSSKRITHILLGNEIDGYLGQHREESAAFISFYRHNVERIHQKMPGVKVGTIITASGAGPDYPTPLFDEINKYSDFVDYTYYPVQGLTGGNNAASWQMEPVAKVASYLTRLAERADNKSFAFTEIGYAASPQSSSSEDQQAAFVREMFRVLDPYQKKGKIEFIAYSVLHDAQTGICRTYGLSQGLPPEQIGPLCSFMESLGLRSWETNEQRQSWDMFVKSVKEWTSPPPNPLNATRPYMLAFSILLPPSAHFDELLAQKIALMSRRSDADIEHPDIPWKALLQGSSPENLAKNLVPPINLARSKGMKVFLMLEPLNGLDRSSEADELITLHKSIKDPDVQKLYHDYVIAIARIVKPDYLGLAAEVNTIHITRKDIYPFLVKMVNDAAQDIKKQNPALPLYVSADVNVAWGVANPKHEYIGINDVFQDFAFMNAISFTVSPAQLYNTPEEVPNDYLTRPLAGHGIPVLIDESGWPSQPWQKPSSPEMQARWIKKIGALADSVHAMLVAQLIFNDIDISPPYPPILDFFISQGLVNKDFSPKPALAEWDNLFSRTLTIKKS